ncbi:MAG TPA: hypothetical protein VEA44_19050 [Caulobacter sp.]|nr:hypothetical protein [Caulobacter sp.]
MTETGLTHPGVRSHLVTFLEELAHPDPRPLWAAQTAAGFVSDLDQVYHFFFDDHDLDDRDIGRVLLDVAEVEAIAGLKAALEALLELLPKGSDDQYVEHVRWPEVTRAARHALEILERR